jgi:hypothetical protein
MGALAKFYKVHATFSKPHTIILQHSCLFFMFQGNHTRISNFNLVLSIKMKGRVYDAVKKHLHWFALDQARIIVTTLNLFQIIDIRTCPKYIGRLQ